MSKEIAVRNSQTAIRPQNFDQAWRFAQMIANTSLCPKDYQGKPEEAMAAIIMGSEIGLSPMQAIQNISNINGRPSVWGDAMLAIVQAHPQYRHHVEWIDGEGDKMVAHFKIQRMEQVHEATFSVDDAKAAGLWTKQGPWKQYPRRMLQMRARAFGLRNSFADALRGIQSAEESRDTPIDITPIPVEPEGYDDPGEGVAGSAPAQDTQPEQPAAPPSGGKPPQFIVDMRKEMEATKAEVALDAWVEVNSEKMDGLPERGKQYLDKAIAAHADKLRGALAQPTFEVE